jgi:hypothetical protein
MNDRDFLAAFATAAIPSERWTHQSHVRVAFLYLRMLPFDEALERVRIGILALNRANGVETTATSGYHETITVAWARLSAAAIQEGDARDFAAFAESNPQLLAKSLLRAYYSKDRLLSPEARAGFVEPDLSLLP